MHAACRWTPELKQQIRESRINVTMRVVVGCVFMCVCVCWEGMSRGPRG